MLETTKENSKLKVSEDIEMPGGVVNSKTGDLTGVLSSTTAYPHSSPVHPALLYICFIRRQLYLTL